MNGEHLSEQQELYLTPAEVRAVVLPITAQALNLAQTCLF